jgi:dipeptidyl aminopeptidase/acylaminoacyl peptidase
LILSVDGSDETPKIYRVDVARQKAELIEDTLPWLSGYRLASSEVIRARGKDGLAIEAFLTVPPGEGRHPLIVMPHGGPVGVSDHLHFSRDVQVLASLGYAVLRVNFRGSEGYGKAFREAGYRQLGTLIEDDIDAALAQALAHYPLDASRMCTLGFSYGGYSALIAAVREPERYRCAISVAGISDRLLFFTASDSGRTAEGRKVLEKIIGDPTTQESQMIETSPLYRYREIRIPVMLAHGRLDERVDVEHALRMQRMLELGGNPPVGLIFDDSGHGIDGMENTQRLWSGIAGFLREHLGTPAAVSNSPTAVTPARHPD